MALGGALGPAWAPVTPRHFAWQAWHNLTSTFVSLGRRGTKSHPPSFCVAGVGQMALGGALGPAWAPVTPRHFAWQAWHNLTSTFVSRGRRGTKSHPPSFCVAGVGQMALGGALGPAWAPVTPRHFAWQAWHNLTSTFVSRGRRGTNSHPPSFTHHIVTHHLSHTTLSHTIFDTPLCHTPLCHTSHCHTPSFTHHIVTHTIFLSHTPAFTYNFVTHNFVLLLGPPPPPLSFLPSPSPLQHVVLFLQRSCLVGLSGPLIFSVKWLQAVMKGTSCVRRVRLRSFRTRLVPSICVLQRVVVPVCIVLCVS